MTNRQKNWFINICLFQALLVVLKDYLRTEFVYVPHIIFSPNNSEFTLLTHDNKLNTINLSKKRNFNLLKHQLNVLTSTL